MVLISVNKRSQCVKNNSITKRGLARDCVFKSVYAASLSGAQIGESFQKTLADFSEKGTDVAFAKVLVDVIENNQEQIKI